MTTIKEEVLKEAGMDFESLRYVIDLTLKKVEELIDEINENVITHKEFIDDLKQKLRGGE